MKKLVATILVIATVLFGLTPFVPWTISIIKSIKMSANCLDYLEMSADANSVELAEKHLTTALNYLETHQLTSGNTKIIVYTPKNDIGLWYENLKSAQKQLQEMLEQESLTELEESNALMKLRETLLDSSGCVTYPERISLVPNYKFLFWCNLLIILLWIPCGICWYRAYCMIDSMRYNNRNIWQGERK